MVQGNGGRDRFFEDESHDLVKLPNTKRTLKNKWMFRLKQEDNSAKPRYKARLVVKAFNQKKGVDFEELISSVIKMSLIRVLLGIQLVWILR